MARLRRDSPQIVGPHKNDIVGKFAEMRLTPSQREVTRVLANSRCFIPGRSYQVNPATAHRVLVHRKQYQGDPETAHRDLVHRKPTKPSRSGRGILEMHDNGLPMPLYKIIKKVVVILEHLKTHPNDEDAKSRLEIEENGVEVASSYFKAGKAMPSDWKYERENANELLT